MFQGSPNWQPGLKLSQSLLPVGRYDGLIIIIIFITGKQTTPTHLPSSPSLCCGPERCAVGLSANSVINGGRVSGSLLLLPHHTTIMSLLLLLGNFQTDTNTESGREFHRVPNMTQLTSGTPLPEIQPVRPIRGGGGCPFWIGPSGVILKELSLCDCSPTFSPPRSPKRPTKKAVASILQVVFRSPKGVTRQRVSLH